MMEPPADLTSASSVGYQEIPKLNTTYATETPARRRLKIFALDPLNKGIAGNRITIDIPNETIRRGPAGDRIEVIDYDGSRDVYYAPVDLNDPKLLMRDGLDPSESDPRFHQQMVYAVAMRVLENFERALGRPLRFSRGRPLRLLPHAFRGANAFFEPKGNAVLFGYFSADETNPGENLPGQTVFSCLSHDIIAHEVTHAVVYRLRRHFSEPSNKDVLAFHEAIADIVAIFQHFTVPDVLRGEIQAKHGDLRSPGVLLGLAKQFGHGTGKSTSLRSALEDSEPKADEYLRITEPHQRGSLLVAAVFDAFFRGYQNRIRDIVKLSTQGSGVLPSGDLDSDLVTVLATEAAAMAQQVLTMCIRAFEYLPPVDVTFGDYLRALVTSDRDLYPEDKYGTREAMIEAFRVRGIFPEGVISLAEESLVWPAPKPGQPMSQLQRIAIGDLMLQAFFNEDSEADTNPDDPAAGPPLVDAGPSSMVTPGAYSALIAYGHQEAANLGLDPLSELSVQGLHPTFRIASNGRVRLDIVAQFVQEVKPPPADAEHYGGLRMYAGTTVIFDQQGNVRYVIKKPLAAQAGVRVRSLDTIRTHVAALDEADDLSDWRDAISFEQRMIERSNFAVLDAPGLRR
jgi:hypothetical protein